MIFAFVEFFAGAKRFEEALGKLLIGRVLCLAHLLCLLASYCDILVIIEFVLKHLLLLSMTLLSFFFRDISAWELLGKRVLKHGFTVDIHEA